MPSTIETASSNSLIATMKKNAETTIKPNAKGSNANYYTFSIKWQVPSFADNISNSLKNFNVRLSGYQS